MSYAARRLSALKCTLPIAATLVFELGLISLTPGLIWQCLCPQQGQWLCDGEPHYLPTTPITTALGLQTESVDGMA